MCARFFAVYVNNRIIYALTILSSFFGALLCSVSLLNLDNVINYTMPFIKIGKFSLEFGLHIDKLSLIVALVLFLVSFLVQIFSINYMKNEPKKYRFFAYLNMYRPLNRLILDMPFAVGKNNLLYHFHRQEQQAKLPSQNSCYFQETQNRLRPAL